MKSLADRINSCLNQMSPDERRTLCKPLSLNGFDIARILSMGLATPNEKTLPVLEEAAAELRRKGVRV